MRRRMRAKGLLFSGLLGCSLLGGCGGVPRLPDVCKAMPELCQPIPTPTTTPGGPISFPPSPNPTPTPTPSGSPPPSPAPSPEPSPPSPPSPPSQPDEPAFPATTAGGWLDGQWAGNGESPSRFSVHLNSALDHATGRLPNGTPIEDEKAFYRAVREKLKEVGYTTHYDWKTGDHSDWDSELSIWEGCRLESFQVLTSAKKLRRAPGAYRGWGTLRDCAAACPELLPPLGRWGLGVLQRGPNWITMDATPLVGPDGPRCCHEAAGACQWWTDGRKFCTPLPDFRQYASKEVGACNEKAVGGLPQWDVAPAEGSDWHVTENPYQVRFRPAATPVRVKVCGAGPMAEVCQGMLVTLPADQ